MDQDYREALQHNCYQERMLQQRAMYYGQVARAQKVRGPDTCQALLWNAALRFAEAPVLDPPMRALPLQMELRACTELLDRFGARTAKVH